MYYYRAYVSLRGDVDTVIKPEVIQGYSAKITYIIWYIR